MENIFNCKTSSRLASELFKSGCRDNEIGNRANDHLTIHRTCFNNILSLRRQLDESERREDTLRAENEGFNKCLNSVFRIPKPINE